MDVFESYGIPIIPDTCYIDPHTQVIIGLVGT